MELRTPAAIENTEAGPVIELNDDAEGYFLARLDDDDKRELVEMFRVVVQDELKRAAQAIQLAQSLMIARQP